MGLGSDLTDGLRSIAHQTIMPANNVKTPSIFIAQGVKASTAMAINIATAANLAACFTDVILRVLLNLGCGDAVQSDQVLAAWKPGRNSTLLCYRTERIHRIISSVFGLASSVDLSLMIRKYTDRSSYRASYRECWEKKF